MFYKCIAKDDVWLGKYTRDDFWSDYTLIPNELFSEDEYDELISVVPRASKFFEPLDIDEEDTYEMFGARFANESVKRSKSKKISEKIDVPDDWSKENKAVVKGLEKAAKSLLKDKWDELSDKQQHDVVMALAKNLMKYLDNGKKSESVKRSRKIKESIGDIYDFHEDYIFVDRKSVKDFDGFDTDYTMYMKIKAPKDSWLRFIKSGNNALDVPNNWIDGYVFVFGDSDLYTPEDGEFDYECDTEEEAYEWFDNYNGFEDEDDFYESKQHCIKNKVNEARYSGRYYVGDENGIPFREQPDEGYSAIKAVERAQREAERASKMYGEPISETRTWYTILDKDMNRCYELEKGI